MQLRRYIAISIAVVLLGATRRLLWLGGVPNGLFCDEASTGYDAYSILLTGRDQYGEFMPLFARSFGDFNESLYRFLAVPSVAVIDLSAFSVRLPAALAGTITILSLLILGRRWWDDATGLMAAALLAVSPWHLLFSRVAFRSILLPLTICLALVAFDRGLKNNPKWLVWSGVFFGVSLYTYTAARIFVPLLVLVLIAVYFREFVERRREALVFVAIFLASLAVLAPFWLSETGMARAKAVAEKDIGAALRNYLSYCSPSFLFFEGDPILRHSAKGFGQLHRFEMLTVIAGLGFALKRREKPDLVLLAWLALFPLAAALTGPDKALRSLVGAPALALTSAIGIVGLVKLLPNPLSRRWAAAAMTIVLLASAGVFLHHYFVEYPQYSARDWQYGMEETFKEVAKNGAPCVVFSGNAFLPHISHLFYNKVPPPEYQATPVPNLSQRRRGTKDYSLGNFHVAPVESVMRRRRRCVFVAIDDELSSIPIQTEVLRVVKDPEGQPLFTIFRRLPPQEPLSERGGESS